MRLLRDKRLAPAYVGDPNLDQLRCCQNVATGWISVRSRQARPALITGQELV